MIAFEMVEAAIHAWLVAGSGLGEGQVYWSDRGPIPAGTRIAMRWGDIETPGHDWVDRRRTDDGDIEYTVRGPRVIALELQCLAPAGSPENGPDMRAAILDRAIRTRMLPSRAAALSLAGVGLGKIGAVRTVPGGRSGLFEPRAIALLLIHLADEVSEIGPAIEHVELEGDVSVEGNPDPIVDTLWVPDEPAP